MSLSLLAGRAPQQPPASEFDAASHELAAKVRARPAVAARHAWLRVVRDSWALSAAATGRLCGVDHTTVLAAVRRSA